MRIFSAAALASAVSALGLATANRLQLNTAMNDIAVLVRKQNTLSAAISNNSKVNFHEKWLLLCILGLST